MSVASAGACQMSNRQFRSSLDGEARLLLLIERFSRRRKVLEGRTKLAKLDFFLRYPEYFQRALRVRRPTTAGQLSLPEIRDIDSRMVRYRYGPWDPTYFAVLGNLIGKCLVQPVPFNRGLGYQATESGRSTAKLLRSEPAWQDTAERLDLLKRHFDLSGTTLKDFVYENFPEVTRANWGEVL